MYLLETRYCNCNIIVLMALMRVETIVGRTRLFIHTFQRERKREGFLLDSMGNGRCIRTAFYYRLQGTLGATIVIFCENTISEIIFLNYLFKRNLYLHL